VSLDFSYAENLHQSPGKSMEFATISTIDLQRLEKALTPLGGLSGTVQSSL